MTITLPQKSKGIIERIELMIELSNIFNELANQIEFSDKISDVILLHVNKDEMDIWRFVKEKKEFIEKKLKGNPAKVINGHKRIFLNNNSNNKEG